MVYAPPPTVTTSPLDYSAGTSATSPAPVYLMTPPVSKPEEWRTRLIVTIVMILCATVALVYGSIEGEAWERILMFAGGAYISSETVVKGIATYKNHTY